MGGATATATPAASGSASADRDDDDFKGYTDLLSARFRTPLKRGWYLALVFVTCCMASGPLNAWVTLEPLLVEQGVFEPGNMTNRQHLLCSVLHGDHVHPHQQVQTYAWSSAMLLAIPIGIVYDCLGPAATAALGAGGAAVGIACMAMAIEYSHHKL